MLHINHNEKDCYDSFGKQLGQMFILFDPVIQLGGLYNKKNSKTNQDFKVRMIQFKNLNSPFISWGTLNTYVSYLTSLCLSSLSVDYG